MTVALDEAIDPGAADEWRPEARPAGWWQRAAAFGIDVLAGLGLVVTALLVGWSAPLQGWLWWLSLLFAALVVLAIAVNRLLLPAITGWSLGRAVVGIAVVRRDGDPVGPWQLALRDLAHIVDTIPLFLGWLWALLDSRGRTFADMLVGTEVHQIDEQRPDWRRLAALVVGGAAAASVLMAAVGYFAVYRQHNAVARAHAEISEQGPKIVSDMLSYTVKNAVDDFTRAQTLVTDGYRPELMKQQEAVRQAGLVDNDYWVSNGAVLSASADHAAMLLLLQGQRGVAPNQRFVTASVRVEYEKSGGQWKVANLTVLTPPKSGGSAAPADQAKPPQGPPAKPSPSAAQPSPSPAPPPKPSPSAAQPKPSPAPAPKPTQGGR